MARIRFAAAETRTASSVASLRAFAVVSGLGYGHESLAKRVETDIAPQACSVPLRTAPAHRGERPGTEHRASGNIKHVTHITSFVSPLVGAA